MLLKIIFVLFATFAVCMSSSQETLVVETDDGVTTTLSPELEEETTEVMENFTNSVEVSSGENSQVVSGETPKAHLRNGSYFRLTMTVEIEWSDEFLDKNSEAFKNLSTGLGLDLTDFIDNEFNTQVMNLTKFRLIEVQESFDSDRGVFAVFIVSSHEELDGVELHNAIHNRLMISNGFYEYKANTKGYRLENISEEEAGAFSVGKNDQIISSKSTATRSSSKKSSEILPILAANLKNVQDEHGSCKPETIERQKTAIYIFEDNKECIKSVRSQFGVKNSGASDLSNEMMADAPAESECKENLKSSVDGGNDADETIIIVKRKGNKIFIEM